MKRTFSWDIAVILAARIAGLIFVAGVIWYMIQGYLSDQYLRDDPALTLIAIMVLTAGAVFAVYCTIMDTKRRMGGQSPASKAIKERK